MTRREGPPDGLLEHPWLRRLAAMRLDPDDFVIIGSGPLLARNLRTRISDLDVVARNRAWDRVCDLGIHGRGRYSGDKVVSLWDGRLQFSQQWIPGSRPADELIDDADLFAGLRFARLEDVLAYKQDLRRAKDRRDIPILIEYLREESGYGTAAGGQ